MSGPGGHLHTVINLSGLIWDHHPSSSFPCPWAPFNLTPSTQTWPELYKKCICAHSCLLLSWFVGWCLLDYFQSYAMLSPSFVSSPASSHVSGMNPESMLKSSLLLLLSGSWMLFITMLCLGLSMGPVAILTLVRPCERASCWCGYCCVGLSLGSQVFPALGGALILLIPAVVVVKKCSLSLLHLVYIAWFWHKRSPRGQSEYFMIKTQTVLLRVS